jgi:ribosomal protein L11 methyltransferase
VQLLVVTVPADELELASGELWSWDIGGIEERASDVAGCVDLVVDGDPDRLAEAIAGRWPTRRVDLDADAWVESWRPWARAVEVADGLSVRPPWVEPLGTDLEVVIDPERAWGHGAHPTTVLCAGYLARRRPTAGSVLDVGCGSGTLSIAAALLGADRVRAIDVDPEAVVATRANAEANGVAAVVEVDDDDLAAVDGRFEVVVANIGAGVLRSSAAELAGRLAPGGSLALSGFLVDDVDLVVGAFATLAVERVSERDGWALVVLG